jgi:hypothetical protein
MCYLHEDSGALLLELLQGNGGLHDLGGVVNLAILDHLEGILKDGLHSSLALGDRIERGSFEHTVQEVLKHDDLGKIFKGLAESLILGLTVELLTSVGLDNRLGEDGTHPVGGVHDGLESDLVEVQRSLMISKCGLMI